MQNIDSLCQPHYWELPVSSTVKTVQLQAYNSSQLARVSLVMTGPNLGGAVEAACWCREDTVFQVQFQPAANPSQLRQSTQNCCTCCCTHFARVHSRWCTHYIHMVHPLDSYAAFT